MIGNGNGKCNYGNGNAYDDNGNGVVMTMMTYWSYMKVWKLG
jgi:hypothetical protein